MSGGRSLRRQSSSTFAASCAVLAGATLALLLASSRVGASQMSIEERLAMYTEVTLEADLSDLSDRQLAVIDRLVRASTLMDELFWRQSCCFRDSFLPTVEDAQERAFARINYGPWDRLNGNEPFVEGASVKPLGAGFYPEAMTREEFAFADLPARWKGSPYTLVGYGPDGGLTLVPYHVAFFRQLSEAAALLREAAVLTENASLARYLELRAKALLNSEYQASDFAWMDVRDNRLDVVIGPIETYEDQLLGVRTAFESYVLLKDTAWSERLARYTQFLPAMQEALPVPAAYRAEKPGSDSELNAYDVLYVAGHANAGSKTIAINLPNDEEVQLQRGTRRLQLKNAMRAKFDRILVPISEQLIAEEQRQHITFDAFFANVMFHEVAHGLGIKNTLAGTGTVREALGASASAIEEGKADILGLYMVTQLALRDVLPAGELMDNYVTFLASIMRSVRFGAASAHGKANMICFNFFAQAGAFVRDETTGTYRVDFARMQRAMTALSRKLLMIQGDGDAKAARELLADAGVIGEQLQSDLDRLADAGIAVDVVFRQGLDVLGLEGRDLPEVTLN